MFGKAINLARALLAFTCNKILSYSVFSKRHPYLYVSCFSNLPTTASIINSSNKRPYKLNAAGEQFTEIRQNNKKQGNTNNGVNYGQSSSRCSNWRHMTVTLNKIDQIIKIAKPTIIT